MDNPIYGIDATNAGLFSQAAYHGIKTDESSVLPGWTEDLAASQTDGTNQVRVFVNNSTGVDEAVMAFKGSNNPANFKDDLFTNGADSYSSFYSFIAAAYAQTKTDDPGDTVIVDGHSLGGGLAQDFALQTGLNGFGQNSLPVTNGTASSVQAYQAAHQFIETNVAGDPATIWYSKLQHGLYLDNNPTELPSIYPSIEAAGMTADAGQSDLGVVDAAVAFYRAHSIATVNALTSQYGLGADGHLNVRSQSTDLPTNAAIWFMESFSQTESIADNGNGSYSVNDIWDDQCTVSVTGSDSGSGQNLTISSTEAVTGARPAYSWTGTLTAGMTNSDVSNPTYSVSWNESSDSQYEYPDSETYTYNADGSFSGQYNAPPQDISNTSYSFSFNPSTGILTGNGGDGPGALQSAGGYTYNSDGSSSGSQWGSNPQTSQFSVSSDGTATWDNSITDSGGYAYTDNYIVPTAGGYEEFYADNSGSWEYAQNADGVETV